MPLINIRETIHTVISWQAMLFLHLLFVWSTNQTTRKLKKHLSKQLVNVMSNKKKMQTRNEWMNKKPNFFPKKMINEWSTYTNQTPTYKWNTEFWERKKKMFKFFSYLYHLFSLSLSQNFIDSNKNILKNIFSTNLFGNSILKMEFSFFLSLSFWKIL